MVTRRVKTILAWVVAGIVVLLLFSGGWWLASLAGVV
jgi:hypothetical protein